MKRLLLLSLLLMLAPFAHATVPAVPFTVTFNCTGGFGPFPFTFPISSPSALTVQLNGVTLASTSYTLTPVNANFANGGKVTLGGSFPCNSGSTLVLTRVTPITQTVNFYDNMPSLPIITGNSVDKLTEIAQELQGLIAQISGHGGVTSIQMQNGGINYGAPVTGIATWNFVGITVSGTSPNLTFTGSGGGGGVTSVTGTTNQVDVATGTTTPVISLDNNIIFPGAITMNANAANFGAASSFKMPTYPSATASSAGFLAYDSTAKSTHFQTNNTDSIAAAFASAPAGSKCLHTNGTTGLVAETSGDCTSLPGGTGIIRVNSGTPAVSELSGDVTTSGSNATTLATVNSNVGSYTNANITVNAKGLITAAANGTAGTVGTGTINGSAYYNTTTSVASTTPPTVNGQYILGYTVTGGVSVAPTAKLMGVAPRGVTGTTDTILYSDSNNVVEYGGSTAVAVSLPTPTTLGNANFYTILDNLTTGSSTAVTVTPATWTINGGATLVIAIGQKCRISVDPNNATNWLGLCGEPPIVAGTNITVSRTNAGITINSSASGTVTSVTGVSPIASTGGATPAISLQNSAAANVTAALGTDTKYFTASGSAATNGHIITGDAQGGIADSGTALSSLPAVICSGTITFNPGATSSNTCSSASTTTCTGLATTDNIMLDFNADPTGSTGYSPGAMGTIVKYPTANTINVKFCNNTTGSLTPASVTLNYRVVR